MKTKHLLASLSMVLVATTFARSGTPELPTTALEFQQVTNSRIAVEGNALRFFTGNEERMTVDENGNIGVGITAPQFQLHLKDPIGGAILGLERGGKLWRFDVTYDGASRLFLSHSDTPGVLSLTDQGRIGVGINDPEGKLTIQQVGNGWDDGLRINRDVSNYLTLTEDVTDIRLKNWGAGGIRLFTSSTEAVSVKNNGNVGIGTPDPGNYKLNVAGQLKATGLIDVGLDRPSDASTEGIFVKGVDGNGYTSINLATKSWSGTHGIIFNAYKSATQVPGGISSTGNTKFTHDVGAYSGGAGMIQFVGNGGVMQFLVSQTSTGAGTDVNWGTPKMMIQRDGTIGINTSDPDETYKLHVAGGIRATNYKSDANSYADFVFNDDYQLPTLKEVEKFIEENNHLPDIPSEAEAKANGIDLQEMQAKLLQKIEELTLYVIELKKENEDQQQRIKKLESIQPMAKSK